MQKKAKKAKQHSRKDTASVWSVLIGFFCAFLLSRIRLHSLHAPLALALLLACQLTDTESLGVLGGILVGAVVNREPMWHTIAVGSAYWAILRILPLVRVQIKRSHQFILFAALGVVSLPVNAVYGFGELLYGTASIAIALLASPLFVRLLKSIRSMHAERVFSLSEQAIFAFFLSCLLLALKDVTFFGWSLSIMLLTFGTMVAVTVRGVYGVAAAALWTGSIVLYAGAEPSLIGSVTFAALLGSMLYTRGRPFVFLAFVLPGVLFEAYAETDALAMNVQNLLSGALFYFLLPRKWLDRLSDLVSVERQTEAMRTGTIRSIEQHAAEKISEMGDLLKDFSSMYAPPSVEDDAIVRWTVEAALTVCQSCDKRSICWQDAGRMQKTVLRLAKSADAGKRVTTVDPIFPTCPRFADLCGSVVLSYQQALARDAVFEQARQQSAFANKQFLGVGDALMQRGEQLKGAEREQADHRKRVEERLLSLGVQMLSFDWIDTQDNRMFRVVLKRPLRRKREEIATEIERACGFRLRTVRVSVERQAVTFEFEQDAKMHASMRVGRTEEQNAVSGDATGECRLSNGRVCFALSDGMGRGASARAESEAAIRLLFRLYRAGMERELIYDTVNRMLMAHNETETYATLDAVSIDLNTGEAEILKYGAPPSFLLRNGGITPIDGEALPCGILAQAKPSIIRIRLQADDRLVFCTDGVQDVLPDGAEQTLKRLEGSKTPLHTTLLKIAQSRKGTDDMTVMVIHVA